MARDIGRKVANKLTFWDGPPYNIPEIVDIELQEVREVLDIFLTQPPPHGLQCPTLRIVGADCGCHIQRARILMAQLQKGNQGEQ